MKLGHATDTLLTNVATGATTGLITLAGFAFAAHHQKDSVALAEWTTVATTAGMFAPAVMGAIAAEAADRISKDALDGLSLGPRPFNGRTRLLTVDELEMLRQLKRDLTHSPLGDVQAIQAVKADVGLSSDYGTAEAFRFRQEVDRLFTGFPSDFLLNQEPFLSAAVRLLERREDPIRIKCLAGQTAIIAALHLAKRLYSINLQISCTDTSGGAQLLSVVDQRESASSTPFEYVFASDSDLLKARTFDDAPVSLLEHYHYVLPVHAKKQFFMRKPHKGTSASPLADIRRVKFVRYGCAEQHWQTLRRQGAHLGREGIAGAEAHTLTDDVGGDVGILIWEQSLRAFKDTGLERMVQLDDTFWVSLFGLRDRPQRAEQDAAFVSVFSHAWMLCRQDLDLAEAVLAQERLLSSYRNVIYLH